MPDGTVVQVLVVASGRPQVPADRFGESLALGSRCGVKDPAAVGRLLRDLHRLLDEWSEDSHPRKDTVGDLGQAHRFAPAEGNRDAVLLRRKSDVLDTEAADVPRSGARHPAERDYARCPVVALCRGRLASSQRDRRGRGFRLLRVFRPSLLRRLL